MKYVSTRAPKDGGLKKYSFSEAVSEGLAPDGGLFVPDSLPDISGRLAQWENLPYAELCFEFLKLFADDIPESELKRMAAKSYSTFDDPQIAPVRTLADNLRLMELYHGPTLAFKDFALQFLGNLYEYLLSKIGRKINVLGATSGDTGSAAINGLLGKRNVNIFILYPEGRISPLQERQMTCTGADNVFPIAVRGTFDDAQRIVKELFGDVAFKEKYRLSAVNSINLARILAQCVYYIYAYLRLPAAKREAVRFAVPTGNFGNVFAGWLASQCGLKNVSFRVATNRNDILYRLFSTGVYETGRVMPSYAPSMDIQIASNFERFIYFMCGRNAELVRGVMEEFKRTGKKVFDAFSAPEFSASRMDDAEIEKTIAAVYAKYGKVVDPHTACAFKDLDGDFENVVLSTASPAKFPALIEKTLGIEPKADSLEILKGRKIVNCVMDADRAKIADYIKTNAI